MADNKATSKAQEFKALSKKDQQRKIGDLILNNAMYIIIAIAIIFITVKQPKFISLSSIVNIISLTAAKLPIALGIGGCIVLTGTDISAGRVVGLAACISASLLTTVFKVFPNMTSAMPIPVVLLIVLGVGAAVGFVNGFSVAKFKLHPFIVTLSTQLRYHPYVLNERCQQRTDLKRTDRQLPFSDHRNLIHHRRCCHPQICAVCSDPDSRYVGDLE